jgi:transposase
MTTNEKLWSDRIKQWRSSGLGVNEFAKSIGVSRFQFHYWRQRLEPEKPRSPNDPRFIELVNLASAAPAPPPCIEIVAPNGITVRVPPSFDPDTLCRVLAFVKENR